MFYYHRYVILCTLDWIVLLRIAIDALEDIPALRSYFESFLPTLPTLPILSSTIVSSDSNIVSSAMSAVSTAASTVDTIDTISIKDVDVVVKAGKDAILSLSIGLLYTVLYVMRHNALFFNFASTGVEWNRGLFDADFDSIDSANSVDSADSADSERGGISEVLMEGSREGGRGRNGMKYK